VVASPDAGLRARLEAACGVLAAVVSELDPGCLTGGDATVLYACFAGFERLSIAGKTLLAPRIEASGVWRETGHSNAATMLASLEGVSAGQAKHTLTIGHRLGQLPGTEDAVRKGILPAPKLHELTGAGVLDPAREPELLNGAAAEPLQLVKERCHRSRATSRAVDPLATVKGIRAARHFSSWTDADGAFCYQGRDTADRGAQILAHLAHVATRLRRARRADGADGAADTHESERAVRADAVFTLLTQRQIGPAGRPDPESSPSGPPASHRARTGPPGTRSPGTGPPSARSPGTGPPSARSPGTGPPSIRPPRPPRPPGAQPPGLFDHSDSDLDPDTLEGPDAPDPAPAPEGPSADSLSLIDRPPPVR
jgi:hypothetical protein